MSKLSHTRIYDVNDGGGGDGDSQSVRIVLLFVCERARFLYACRHTLLAYTHLHAYHHTTQLLCSCVTSL